MNPAEPLQRKCISFAGEEVWTLQTKAQRLVWRREVLYSNASHGDSCWSIVEFKSIAWVVTQGSLPVDVLSS
jgi:hypothetical protein